MGYWALGFAGDQCTILDPIDVLPTTGLSRVMFTILGTTSYHLVLVATTRYY